MSRCTCPRPRVIRWTLMAALLGTLLGSGTSCDQAIEDALLTGARSTASALLNAFFDNIASGDDFTPVTVKAL